MTKKELLAKYSEEFEELEDLSVDVGWYPLIDELCGEMAATKIKYKIQCVKEKFGSMRFHFDLVNSTWPGVWPDEDPPRWKEDEDKWDVLSKIVSKFEAKSMSVCEVCGKPGQLRRGEWIKTLCNEHAGEKKILHHPLHDKDHACITPWDKCPECNIDFCNNCSAACYECVKAWRHVDCAQKHIQETKHHGNLNDLIYLIDR